MSRDIYADIPVQPTLRDLSERVLQCETKLEKARAFGEWFRFAVYVEEVRDIDVLNALAHRDLNAQHDMSLEQWRDVQRSMYQTFELPSVELTSLTLAT